MRARQSEIDLPVPLSVGRRGYAPGPDETETDWVGRAEILATSAGHAVDGIVDETDRDVTKLYAASLPVFRLDLLLSWTNSCLRSCSIPAAIYNTNLISFPGHKSMCDIGTCLYNKHPS